MNKQQNNANGVFMQTVNALLLVLSLSACGSSVQATNPASAPVSTPVVETIAPAPTALRTPPALPPIPQVQNLLNPLDTPRVYIQDPCQYIRAKWSPVGSEPGTIVMIVMLKGIYRGMVEAPGGVNINDYRRIADEFKRQGFEAISTKQFLSFMERNAKIPFRSVLIIQDDNRTRENFDRIFRRYWNDWGWPLVNGWTSQANTAENLWQDNIELENEGFIDHQPQGVQFGTVLSDDSSKAVIMRELEGSMTAFKERYKKTPIAFIWQNGGFGQRPVEAARLLGYQLGFTSNSRGPVMFNWVPQADEFDPERRFYIPEGKIKDPLMTLPRYWPYQVMNALDAVRLAGEEAKAYAEANKAVELEYYDIVCAPVHGSMPIAP